jgi:hypothetical protein
MSQDDDKLQQELSMWRKKIELIGVDIKALDKEIATGRLKLKTGFMNQHFINELDRIGLQLISITVGSIFTRALIVTLEPKT